MDTIEAMQYEINELKAEVLRLKREAGNLHARNGSKFIQYERLIHWQRSLLEKLITDSHDQYDDELWARIGKDY